MNKLERLAYRIVLEARYVSESPGADFVPSGSRQYEEKPPTGISWSMADKFDARFSRCETEADWREQIAKCLRDLQGWKKQERSPTMTPQQLAYWIIEEYEGETPEVVAIEENLTVPNVKQIRFRQGRRTHDGTLPS